MTDKQREELVKALAARTKAATISKKAAREFLIREGYLTSSGELSPNFGGKKVSAG